MAQQFMSTEKRKGFYNGKERVRTMQDQILFWGGLIFTAVFIILGLIFLAVWLLRWKNLQFELEREYGKKAE